MNPWYAAYAAIGSAAFSTCGHPTRFLWREKGERGNRAGSDPRHFWGAFQSLQRRNSLAFLGKQARSAVSGAGMLRRGMPPSLRGCSRRLKCRSRRALKRREKLPIGETQAPTSLHDPTFIENVLLALRRSPGV